MIYPISYSFPAELMVSEVPLKKTHTASHSYQFDDSSSYLENYGGAYFGKTTKRAGWDCLRHYEILSQGTIPYFPDLHLCPGKTMVPFPKHMILELNEKYYEKSFEQLQKESSSHLHNTMNSLLSYTKENLTTEKSVESMLERAGNTKAKEILFLTNLVQPETDYLFSLLTHGFKKLSKGRVDCYPEFDYHYKSYPLEFTKKLYGCGFNYTRLLPDDYKTELSKSEIERKVKNHEYDCIYLFMNEYTDTQVPIQILNTYTNSEISLICGNDCDAKKDEITGGWTTSSYHTCFLKEISHLQNLFVRELCN